MVKGLYLTRSTRPSHVNEEGGGYSQPSASPSSIFTYGENSSGEKRNRLPNKIKGGGGGTGEAGRKINYLVVSVFCIFPAFGPS